ncbi:MAG: error-prone DNA polymerase, partial [Planctomycetales bacterium]|nr:error-prone DNA polymerase [Planctomycetales bacterium]
VLRLIRVLGQYVFLESKAASFALLVYVSAYLKHYYPAAFCAAIINSQPMGFYAPAQLVRNARDHGVEVRPIDVNHSGWDCTLEPVAEGAVALRLGMRLLQGMPREAAARLEQVRDQHGSFHS